MKCPNCKADQTKCIDSRQSGTTRRRRYRCRRCGSIFNTVEYWTEIRSDQINAEYRQAREGLDAIEKFLAWIGSVRYG